MAGLGRLAGAPCRPDEGAAAARHRLRRRARQLRARALSRARRGGRRRQAQQHAHGALRRRPELEAEAARQPLHALVLRQPAGLADGQAGARLALQLLRGASAHGIDPARYGVDGLAQRLAHLREPDAAAFERDLTRAMLQYLAELHFGRIVSAYRPGGWDDEEFDPAAQLAQGLRQGRLAETVAAAPALPLYGRIQATLAAYRALARAHPAMPALPPPARPAIAAGAAYEGATLLRERLRLLGDLDAQADAQADTQADAQDEARDDAGGIYTAALSEAVRRFQSRHGLPEDGVLDAATLAALAVPLAQRVTRLELTLERLRWLPPLPAGRLVAVNIHAYRLWAFDSRASLADPRLEMRIIVGTAAGTPTPLFIGRMRYLEFNPYWNVPRSIELGEILSRLARNPAYLQQNDMELVSRDGQVLADPQRWDRDAIEAAIRSGQTRTVPLPAAVPVVLFYATAVTDRHGRAIFAPDIYGRDAPLARALGAAGAGPDRAPLRLLAQAGSRRRSNTRSPSHTAATSTISPEPPSIITRR